MSQMDPWATGTPAYRVCLITGMGATFLGIIAVVAAALVGNDGTSTALRSVGLVLIGLGLMSHLVGIGLRRRQAAHIIKGRKNQQ